MSAGVYIRQNGVLVPAATVPGPKGSQGPTGGAGPKGDPGGWVATSAIADTTDLDTLITPGLYYRGVATGNTLALHYPLDGFFGYVEVVSNGGTSVMQRATTVYMGTGATTDNAQGKLFVRTKTSGGWSAWQRITVAGNPGGSDLVGTGSPEGSVTAPVGTYYTDTAGTFGAWRWLKKTGTSNGGWKVVIGDTGKRDVTSLLNSEWNNTGSYVYLRRINDTVFLSLNSMVNPTNVKPSNPQIFAMPAGFNNQLNNSAATDMLGYSEAQGSIVTQPVVIRPVSNDIQVLLNRIPANPTFVRGQLQWPTLDAWPTTLLPGTAA